MGLPDGEVERWLDHLEHRGPDGRGVWRAENVLLGHTRLAVRDPHNDGSAQPIVTPCGRFALAYNGELYNDTEVRARIEARVLARTAGRGFATRCDAETVLWALALEGPSVLDELRGMYAVAFVDLVERTLTLARDPLGVKPLHYAQADGGVVFASEAKALAAHPSITARPDMDMLGAYLATSRRTLDGRTLFEGVRTVRPGEVLSVDLANPSIGPRLALESDRWTAPVDPTIALGGGAEDAVKDVIEASVLRHLVSDVPVCGLLSGGLDSSILCSIVTPRRPDLATWCAGGVEDGDELGPDPRFARAVAVQLGTRHTDVTVDRAEFLRGWREHVAHLGQPLSTPNEVAIAEMSRAIRRSGAIVALSGEGADELFGGYDGPLAAFSAHAAMADPPIGAARFHLESTAWIAPASQTALLQGSASDFVIDAYERAFLDARRAAGAHGTDLDAHLGMQRQINLTSLLERLDAASMRFGIEGRTPFADLEVARHAQRAPMGTKFSIDGTGVYRSKIALREAFRPGLPADVVDRPKASFPLPFQSWCAGLARDLPRSEFLRSFVREPVLTSVVNDPEEQWRLMWLLGNLALWAESALGVALPGGDRLRVA